MKFAFPARLHYKTDVRSYRDSLAISAILLALMAGRTPAQTASSSPQRKEPIQPQRLVSAAVTEELKQGYGRRPYLVYRLDKQTAHLNRVQTLYETQDGDVACRLAADGRALTGADWQVEEARLLRLREQPALQKHRQRRELDDVRHFEKFLRALPDAFDYTDAGRVQTAAGEAERLTFTPRRGYQPSDYETRLLRSMHGEIWIDARQQRIAYFSGELFQNVDFGWGILGTIQKGGTLRIQQAEAVPGVWTLSELKVDITGRALLVEKVQEHIHERETGYALAAPVQSYTQAIDALLRTRCETLPAPARSIPVSSH